ncbi:transposase zinc-binding domain-containing protein [Sorangium sp. So ce375]|uniref:transposase zinc-binding domain-containing protein n=1 Tax=Sorangium sp. So ce375 TaxID=3133306 RepID=UPI003F5B8749
MELAFPTYLACRDFSRGFCRSHCGAWGHDLLVTFSCKGRGLCPSCGARRMSRRGDERSEAAPSAVSERGARIGPVLPVNSYSRAARVRNSHVNVNFVNRVCLSYPFASLHCRRASAKVAAAVRRSKDEPFSHLGDGRRSGRLAGFRSRLLWNRR